MSKTEDEFWRWVDDVRSRPNPAQFVRDQLGSMSDEEALWTNYWQCLMNGKARLWPLFDFLAMAFDDSFGDDSFMLFRMWLVYQGQDVHAAAIDNPDSLVSLLKSASAMEMLSGDGPYCVLADHADGLNFEKLDKQALPPDFAWPRLSGESADEDEDELKSVFPSVIKNTESREKRSCENRSVWPQGSTPCLLRSSSVYSYVAVSKSDPKN